MWEEVDEGELRSIFYVEIMGVSKSVWSNYVEKEYMASLKNLIYTRDEFNTKRHLINMKNGMFDTLRLKLIPHDPEYYSTIQIPVEYNKCARCDLYMKFLKQVFEGDKERIQKAIEWLGYCISTETKAQKALIEVGFGGNGKGVYTESICWVAGEDNLSHIPLNELHKNFSRATLFGKTVNISSENEMGGKNFMTQFFKAITGEDTIHAEFKNKPVFTFKPTVKMVISMNNLPQTKDRSDGVLSTDGYLFYFYKIFHNKIT